MISTKESPLSIIVHPRAINLPCLKQRFDDCRPLTNQLYCVFCSYTCILHYFSLTYFHIKIFLAFLMNTNHFGS